MKVTYFLKLQINSLYSNENYQRVKFCHANADLKICLSSVALLQHFHFIAKTNLLSQIRGGFMTTMRFFVIGSWTEGMLHFQKLKPFIVSYEQASLQGHVYRLPAGFPVIVQNLESEQSDQIIGQLVEIKSDQTLIALMDSFHGVHQLDELKGVHVRRSLKVKKTSGDIEEAQVYLYNSKKLTAKAERIPFGIWQDEMKNNPPLTEQLSDRQKGYVLKLGAAKARDIVPINDLSLYRELIKLEIIVDKGRRLALSSLGKEVYKHLT